jgi:hypothetical protein
MSPEYMLVRLELRSNRMLAAAAAAAAGGPKAHVLLKAARDVSSAEVVATGETH